MRPTLCLFLLCISVSLRAQQPAADKTYKLFFEKVYLHTDREMYAAGEDIWFKAYLLNGQTNQLINTSNNLYVELISPDAKIAARKLIRLDNGLGNGDFHLADSIAAGAYHIRAYTNWMRNFGDKLVFEKKLTVVPDSVFSVPLAVQVPAKQPKASPPSALKTGTAAGLAGLSFYPEGGSMIEGVSSVIAFKSIAKQQMLSGNVVSASGQIITSLKSDSSGTGSFFLAVEPGQRYVVKGNYADGTPFSTDLPQAMLQGFSLNIRTTDSLFRITVSTNQQTLSAQQQKPLQLVARSKGKTIYAANLPLASTQVAVYVPKDGFPAGIASFTLYDAQGRAQCERLVFAEASQPLILELQTNKQAYRPKEQVSANIRIVDGNNAPVKASLSVAVVDGSVVQASGGNISSYLNLQSELKGEIEQAAKYFDPLNPRRKQQLDLLLLTQGWRDFLWKRLADSALRISYALEQGITVSGTVTDKGKPAADANITLSAPGAKGTRLLSSSTDSAGRYYFDAVGLWGNQFIKLTSHNDKGQKFGAISLDSIYSAPLPLVKKPLPIEDILVPEWAVAIRKRSEMVRLQAMKDTIKLKEVEIKANRFVQLYDGPAKPVGADEVFNIEPKDNRMSIMQYLQQYSKAIVGEVRFRGSEPVKPGTEEPTDPPYTIFNLLYFQGRGGNYIFPRMIIDGKEMPYTDDKEDTDVMVANQGLYFSLGVDKLKKIIVRKTIGQARIEDGRPFDTPGGLVVPKYLIVPDIYIVYLTFKEGALMPPQLEFVKANVNGYYQARTFYAPKYETLSTKPDLRTTIHWEPNITTNEKGEATITWYNADPKTKVRITVEGITDKGVPVVGTAVYEVK